MDALDRLILDKRGDGDKLRAALLKNEAEIAVLELAARLRPVAAASIAMVDVDKRDALRTTGATPRHGGGRKPGDISHAWRRVLAGMNSQEGRLSYDRITALTAQYGLKVTLSSVRDRVRNFLATGLVEGDPENGFAVTQDAVERFGFTKENDPPEGGSDTDDVDASSNE